MRLQWVGVYLGFESPLDEYTHTYTGQLTRRDNIEEVFKFIHPDFCQASVVFVDDLSGSSGKRVGRRLSEHMTNVRACDDLQSPTALPNL